MLRIFRAKPVASQSATNQGRATPPVWRGPVLLMIVPGALLATIAFSCNNKDSIWITDPNATGGSSGATGNAGTGGDGNGGNGGSGMAGAAGNSTGGTAGAGGSSGAGGSAGSGGSAGTGGNPNDGDAGDAGPEPDSGGPVLSPRQTTATAICTRLDEIDNCAAPPATCRDDLVGQWEGAVASAQANCEATVDAYFNCQASEPVTSYDCNGGPEFTVPASGSCGDEEAAFFEAFNNPCQ